MSTTPRRTRAVSERSDRTSRATSPRRRSQEARSQETRERTIAATVACVVEDGFSRASLARIAERAGVSIGAIQHQFGDRAGVLSAVIVFGIDDLVRGIESMPRSEADRWKQVHRVLVAMWRHRSLPASRAVFEIQLQIRNDPTLQADLAPQIGRFWRALDHMWMDRFRAFTSDRDRHRRAQRLVISTLNGLTVERMMDPATGEPRADLETLATSVVHLLCEVP